MKPLKQNTVKPKKFTFLRIQTSKAGKLYAEATMDFSISKGERFAVLDPRQFLTEEQAATLENEGSLVMETASGKSYTMYSSLFREIAKFND